MISGPSRGDSNGPGGGGSAGLAIATIVAIGIIFIILALMGDGVISNQAVTIDHNNSFVSASPVPPPLPLTPPPCPAGYVCTPKKP
jgi:hypothetical protein